MHLEQYLEKFRFFKTKFFFWKIVLYALCILIRLSTTMKHSNKYTNTVEEHLASISQSAAKKKKPNKPREEKLMGFEKIDASEEVDLFQSELKTEFNFPDRNPTLLNIFLYFFDNEFIDLLIAENIELTEVHQLPPVFWNPVDNTRRKDLNVERRKLVLKYVATRIFVMSNYQKNLKDNWPFEGISKELYLGRDNFRQMLSNMLIRLTMVEELNVRMGRYILSGRHVMIDEKHKGTNREQHLARWCMAKIQIGAIGLLRFQLLVQRLVCPCY
jgi:hypothetical protein